MTKSNILRNIAHGNHHTRSLRTLTFHLSKNVKQFQWYRNLTPNDLNWPLIMTKYNVYHDIAHANYLIRTPRVLIFHLSTNMKQFVWHLKLTPNDLILPLMTYYLQYLLKCCVGAAEIYYKWWGIIAVLKNNCYHRANAALFEITWYKCCDIGPQRY